MSRRRKSPTAASPARQYRVARWAYGTQSVTVEARSRREAVRKAKEAEVAPFFRPAFSINAASRWSAS